MNLGRWLLLGIVSYAIFILGTLPSTVGLRLLAPEGTTISGVSGSAWQGEAGSVSTNVATLTDVRWDLNVWKLLILKASADVNTKLPGGAIRTQINSSLFGNSGGAYDLRGVVKLEPLSQSLQIPLLVSGNAGIRLDEVRWSDGAIVSALGEIQFADITEKTANTRLGNFSVVFPKSEGDQVQGILSDTDAVFELSGTVLLNVDNTYAVDATIKPTDKTPAGVVTALGFLGANRDSAGNYEFNLSGTF